MGIAVPRYILGHHKRDLHLEYLKQRLTRPWLYSQKGAIM